MYRNLMTIASEIQRRAAQPRDDSGVSHEALIQAGFVTAAMVLVGAVAAYVANQVGVLGG
jgi:hypothetical protein